MGEDFNYAVVQSGWIQTFYAEPIYSLSNFYSIAYEELSPFVRVLAELDKAQQYDFRCESSEDLNRTKAVSNSTTFLSEKTFTMDVQRWTQLVERGKVRRVNRVIHAKSELKSRVQGLSHCFDNVSAIVSIWGIRRFNLGKTWGMSR